MIFYKHVLFSFYVEWRNKYWYCSKYSVSYLEFKYHKTRRNKSSLKIFSFSTSSKFQPIWTNKIDKTSESSNFEFGRTEIDIVVP